jgi:hypothetical protein
MVILMTFPLENILTGITLSEYAATQGKTPRNYRCVGVHVIGVCEGKLIHAFADAVPPNAEVVIGYTPVIAVAMEQNTYRKIEYASGTALIPKE